MTSKRYRKLLMASGLVDRNYANSHINLMKRLWRQRNEEANTFGFVMYFNDVFCYQGWYDDWAKGNLMAGHERYDEVKVVREDYD